LCNYNKTLSGWQQKTVDLSAILAPYKGKQVRLYFQGLTNGTNPTSFFVDDVKVMRS
jgi:hypothetical protein